MEASVLDLRKNMKDILAAIDRRENVILTYRGKRKAIIMPIDEVTESEPKCSDFEACGMWADRDDMADVQEYVQKLRAPRRF